MATETTIQEESTKPGSGWRIDLGRLGETIAVQQLKNSGWRIIAINWRCGHFGEIDVIARDPSKMLVFCEVKTRVIDGNEAGLRNDCFESVHWKKQRKIMTCAMNYIRGYRPYESSCRFDVIAVEFRIPPGDVAYRIKSQRSLPLLQSIEPTIKHVQNAFC